MSFLLIFACLMVIAAVLLMLAAEWIFAGDLGVGIKHTGWLYLAMALVLAVIDAAIRLEAR